LRSALFFLVIFAAWIGPALSKESRPREPERKAETSQPNNQGSGDFQQIPMPFTFWSNNQPFSPIINVYTGKHPNEKSECSEAKDWKELGSFAWCRSLEWIDTDRIIAIWTIILGGATWMLWRVTVKLVKRTDDTAQRQLRAYIYILPATMKNLNPNSLIHFSFLEINAGNTPSYETTHNGIISIEDHPLRPNFPFPVLPPAGQSKMMIGPRVQAQGHILATKIFSQTEFVEIFQGRNPGKRLHIFGQTDYVDAFKRDRWTRFCYSLPGALELIPLAQAGDWQAITNSLESGRALSFEIANQHNESDDG